MDVERWSRLASGSRETVLKSLAVAKYMGGVDGVDQLLCYYGFGHRAVRWWQRVIFFLLTMAAVKSYIVHSSKCTEGKHYTHEQFRFDLVKELLTAAGTEVMSSEHSYGDHHLLPIATSSLPCRPALQLYPVQKIPAGGQLQHNCADCSFKRGRWRKTITSHCLHALDLALSCTTQSWIYSATCR